MPTITPEIEQKAREIYEKTRRVGFVEQGAPWEPIAEALAEALASRDLNEQALEDAKAVIEAQQATQQACQHIEWLIRYVKTSESGDAAGVVLNAREFLAKMGNAGA